ncbi:sensor histidine kinase [Prauserella muralis]|uniref:histidine kinase n=1 Tax=Prauserella muralis TaxID=588067 RepID=A0A2V4AW05_9PSEU|nr:sensor histidine kinase [Prauserella muralis]PXY19747.1 hypothetical protein BAY60_32830 [Prauserella muralis]
MGLASGCLRLVRGHPFALDVVVALAWFVVAMTLPVVFKEPRHDPPSGLGYLLGALACVTLMERRRWPAAVLGLTSALGLAITAVDGVGAPFASAAAVAAFTVVSLDDRPGAGIACAAVALGLGFGGRLFGDGGWLESFNIALGVGFAGAIGHAVRTRRQRLAEMEERARRAEHTREEEARRRVAEERLRIARELHDVVGHHIALINVQATVATHVLDDRPDEARKALDHVRHASRTVLDEISVLLGMLRQSGEQAPTEPVPSLARLDSLVTSFTSAGMAVEHTPFERADELPTAVDLAAYRVVQESLTNAYKHANGARATVELARQPSALRVEVRNDSPSPPPGNGSAPHGTGRGIAGMRERVGSVGGSLEAGPLPDGGFRVCAVLPVPERERSRDQGGAGGRPGADPRGVSCSGRLRTGPVGGG